MKHKHFWHHIVFLFLSAALLLLVLPPNVCHAEDDGFYIEHMDIKATANPDRTYDITETIDVYFTEERHGIIRNIPTSSSTEREVRIENVNVTGAPFEYDGLGTIKIGDPDETVTEKQQYVITYTLWQYADTENDADYLYLNLIGTEWTTYINSFDAEITLPNDAVIQDCTLTGGTYGSKDSDMASYTANDNKIIVTGTRKLQAGEGVTIQVKMPEGTFADALVWTPDLILHEISADYQLDDHGILTVCKEYDATVQRECTFLLTIDDRVNDHSDRLLNASFTLPDHSEKEFTDKYTYLNLDSYVGQRIQFSVHYTMAYDVSIGPDMATLHVHLHDYYRNQSIEHLTATFHVPFAISTPVLNTTSYVSVDVGCSPDTLTLGDEKVSGELTYTDTDNRTRDLYLHVPMYQTWFLRDSTVFDWLIPIISILLAFAVVMLYLREKKPMNPVPYFYPPDDLNPAEIGYIIDNTCQASDIVALIYYWASKGLLSIKFLKKPHFSLTWLKDMDGHYRDYERTLFHTLWRQDQRKTTTDSDLMNHFYIHINKAMASVKKNFQKKNLILEPASVRKAKLFGLLLPGIVMLLLWIADASRGFGTITAFLPVLCAYPCILLFYWITSMYQIHKYHQRKLSYTILKIVLVCFFFSFYFLLFVNQQVLRSPACFITFVCIVTISVLGPCFQKYTPQRQKLLEKAVGFRMFLLTAEKDRLKMLLDANPDYYYNILPYAQVLGVTNQWMHRFDGLTIHTPDWVNSNDPYDMYDRMTLHVLTHSMTSSMTSSPAPDTSSGGYDGGSSGGGSGGGGGSSW